MPKIEGTEPFFLFRISHYHHTVMGAVVTVISGYIISLLTKPDDRPLRLELISPLVHFLVPKEAKVAPNSVEYNAVDKALHFVSSNAGNDPV